MLKRTAVGAGALGVTWAAPRVEGLSLRPNYASAQSMLNCAPYSIAFGRSRSSVFVGSAVLVDLPTGESVGLTGLTTTVNSTGRLPVQADLRGAAVPMNCSVNISRAQSATLVAPVTGGFDAPGPASVSASVASVTVDINQIRLFGNFCCN